jgi:L-ascorbate metabolism protein UlaG (beta-lactamase superfamily)
VKTAVALNLALAIAAPGPEKLEVRFIGNMAFSITDGKTTLLMDFPYQSGAFGYMTYDTAAASVPPGSLCLVTHGHLDHFDPSLFRPLDAALIAPPSTVAKLDKQETKRAIALAPKMSYRDIRIEAFRTPHGDIEHYSYLVAWHGLRLYFTGDTDSTEELLAMRDLDVAFVSPWLIEAVANQKGRIDSRLLVAYHHRAGETVAALQNRRVPKQGETFTLDARAPQQPNRP